MKGKTLKQITFSINHYSKSLFLVYFSLVALTIFTLFKQEYLELILFYVFVSFSLSLYFGASVLNITKDKILKNTNTNPFIVAIFPIFSILVFFILEFESERLLENMTGIKNYTFFPRTHSIIMVAYFTIYSIFCFSVFTLILSIYKTFKEKKEISFFKYFIFIFGLFYFYYIFIFFNSLDSIVDFNIVFISYFSIFVLSLLLINLYKGYGFLITILSFNLSFVLLMAYAFLQPFTIHQSILHLDSDKVHDCLIKNEDDNYQNTNQRYIFLSKDSVLVISPFFHSTGNPLKPYLEFSDSGFKVELRSCNKIKHGFKNNVNIKFLFTNSSKKYNDYGLSYGIENKIKSIADEYGVLEKEGRGKYNFLVRVQKNHQDETFIINIDLQKINNEEKIFLANMYKEKFNYNSSNIEKSILAYFTMFLNEKIIEDVEYVE